MLNRTASILREDKYFGADVISKVTIRSLINITKFRYVKVECGYY